MPSHVPTATQLLVLGLSMCGLNLVAASPPTEPAVEVKAGAYYFDGWTGKTDRWHLPPRLKDEFGHRKPVWGWVTSTPEVVGKQIDAAADHGIEFFAFCWYYGKSEQPSTPLNNALRLFLEAPNQDRLDFCLTIANHAGWSIGPDDWDECCVRWLPLFQHPDYVTANGKPLLIIHSPAEFANAFGGPDEVRTAFDQLQEKAVEAGLPGVSVAGCWTARDVGPGQTLPREEVKSGYDIVTGYSMPHYCAWDWPKKRQPFQHLVDGHLKAWAVLQKESELPQIPVCTLGWDMRPWQKSGIPEDELVVYYPDRTPAAVEQMVRNAVEWIERSPDRTTEEKLLLLYAWNEYGEGGYITPTEQEGDTYLQAVRRGLELPTTPPDARSAESDQ